MFKHILLPTDGSKLSEKAVKLGIEFAKKTRARVTAIHVVPEFKLMADEGIAIMNPAVKKRFDEEGRARAQKMLDGIAGRALLHAGADVGGMRQPHDIGIAAHGAHHELAADLALEILVRGKPALEPVVVLASQVKNDHLHFLGRS